MIRSINSNYKRLLKPAYFHHSGIKPSIPLNPLISSLPKSLSTTPRNTITKNFIRSYATAPPSAFAPPKSNTKRIRSLLLGFTLFGIGGYLLWTLTEYNAYPPAMADKLREALYAESKEDYTTALKYYLEALQEADKIKGYAEATSYEPEQPANASNPLGMPGSPFSGPTNQLPDENSSKSLKFYVPSTDAYYLSDAYTGLLLKIAEMYDRVGLPGDALQIYCELCQSYMYALNANLVPEHQRLDIMRRNLLAALQASLIELRVRPLEARLFLLVHFTAAQQELIRAHPELKEIFAIEKAQITPVPDPNGLPGKRARISTAADDGQSSAPRRFSFYLTLDSSDTKDALEKRIEASKLWEPLRHEFFAVRQIFSELSANLGDIGLAIETSLNTTIWMAAAGYPIDQTMWSFYIGGSYLYAQALALEMKQLQEETDKKKSQTDELEVKLQNKLQETKDPNTLVFPPPGPGSLSDESLKNASSIFKVILDTIKTLPGKARRSSSIAELQALSIYQLGVIALHEGNLKKAEDLLKEARLRAKGCGYNVLVENTDSEIETLEELKKAHKTGDKEAFYKSLYDRRITTSVLDVKMDPLERDGDLSLAKLVKSQ